MAKFENGTPVVVTGGVYFEGATGVVISTTVRGNTTWVGVDFHNEHIWGHTLDGLLRHPTGRYIEEEYLAPAIPVIIKNFYGEI